MTTHITTTYRQLQVFLVALMLVLASTLVFHEASLADMLRPNFEIGVSGGASSAVVVDEVTSVDCPCMTPF